MPLALLVLFDFFEEAKYVGESRSLVGIVLSAELDDLSQVWVLRRQGVSVLFLRHAAGDVRMPGCHSFLIQRWKLELLLVISH